MQTEIRRLEEGRPRPSASVRRTIRQSERRTVGQVMAELEAAARPTCASGTNLPPCCGGRRRAEAEQSVAARRREAEELQAAATRCLADAEQEAARIRAAAAAGPAGENEAVALSRRLAALTAAIGRAEIQLAALQHQSGPEVRRRLAGRRLPPPNCLGDPMFVEERWMTRFPLEGAVLSLFQTDEGHQVRVRQVQVDGHDLLDSASVANWWTGDGSREKGCCCRWTVPTSGTPSRARHQVWPCARSGTGREFLELGSGCAVWRDRSLPGNGWRRLARRTIAGPGLPPRPHRPTAGLRRGERLLREAEAELRRGEAPERRGRPEGRAPPNARWKACPTGKC